MQQPPLSRAECDNDSDNDSGPLALRRRLRNPAVPGAWWPSLAEAPLVDEAAGLRRRLREPLQEARAAWRRRAFVEEARADAPALFDRLFLSRRHLDLRDTISSAADRQRRELLTTLEGGLGGITFDPPPAGVGEMWWGETSYQLPNRIGMNAVFNDVGLLLFGALGWDDGDLFQTAVRVTSSFFLDPARMPAAQHVRSAPGGVLLGQMFGYTGGGKPFLFGGFAEGDHWSKCELRLSQRAWAVNPDRPADTISAAPPANSAMQLIDIDDTADFAEAGLPGGLSYPTLDIVLNKDRILRIDLVLEWFIQLEGNAGIRFGGIGHANPALHQWSQWKLLPL